MPHAPEGTNRTRDNEGWCSGCGRPMVCVDRAWYVISGPDRCTTGPAVGQYCRGGARLCPNCDGEREVPCPVCDDSGDDDTGCRVCDRHLQIPCPVCQPAKLARRVAKTDAGDKPVWAPAPAMPAAIENLNDYRRLLTATAGTVLAELQDALASAQRHQDLAATVTAGMDLLDSLGVDAAARDEGLRVADAALAAKDAGWELVEALTALMWAAQTAATAVARHDTAQDIHTAGLLADRGAYDGA